MKTRLLILALLAGCESLPELPTAVDPVCRARVSEVDAVVRTYRGETFYFDSEKCARIFDGDPQTYRQRAQWDRTERSWEESASERSIEIRDRQ